MSSELSVGDPLCMQYTPKRLRLPADSTLLSVSVDMKGVTILVSCQGENAGHCGASLCELWFKYYICSCSEHMSILHDVLYMKNGNCLMIRMQRALME